VESGGITGVRLGMIKIKDFIFNLTTFFNEVGTELKKSTWPTRPELLQSTVVVIVSVVALGFFVGLSDFILMHVLKLIL